MSWGRARVGVALVVCVVAVSCAAVASASASMQSVGAPSSVIVVLRNQLHSAPDKRGYWAARERDAATTQAPLVAGVRKAGGRVTKQFQLLNAFVATVSPAELTRLRSDPDVSGVYPNVNLGSAPSMSPPQPLALGESGSPDSSALLAAAGANTSEAASAPSTPGVTPDTSPAPTGSIVCGTSADPLLEPEALQLTHTAASANEAAGTYESSTGITGQGVTVAAIADGVDTTNPDLQRSGSPVVTEVDFGGAGSSAGTDGYEMFGDVSSIAAQGNTTYDISNPSISAIPDNAYALGVSGSGCDIRVQGIAPGANVYALDAYPASGGTTEDLVAAINYAVNTAHASVINESFGANPIPDDASDVIRSADQQAFAAGVTVVVSAGDSGPIDTVGSPSTDPDVISVAASTQERAYTQAAIYGGGLATATPSAGFQGETAGSPDGWIDNSVASFSSGGVDEAGDVPDLIAPGEAGWALCSTNALYSGCGGYPLEQFQGTSESAPLVAGAAALVIQAYRNTHAGASPGPALVKQILMSSADDIDAASDEQGAGLLDTDAAVLEAESPTVGTGGTVGAPSQTGILVSTSSNVATPDPSGAKPGQIDVSGTAGSTQSASVTVTNTGSQSEIVTPALRGLSDASAPSTGQVTLDGASGSTDSTYRNGHGDTLHYVKKTFTVPAGTDVLTALAAWPGGASGSATVIVSLTDPSGRWAGSSVFWGNTDSAYAEVDQPEHGTWTVYFATDNGYDGPVNYSLTSSSFGSEGPVSPSSLTLAAGAHGTFTVPLAMPTQAGDESENLNLSTALASAPGTTISTNVVPVALRSFVALGASGGTFSGVVDGGNGWNGTTGTGQVSTYDMNVPAGEPALVVDLDLPSDLGTNLSAFLIDPQGEPVSAAFGSGGEELENVHLNPEAGTWQYVLEDGSVDDGTLTDGAYTGAVRFAVPDQITSSGVPDSASTYVAPGSSVNATITFANHGPTAQQIFIDPRTDTYVQELLYDSYGSGDSIALPNTSGNNVAVLVPNGTVALTATTQATVSGGGGLSGVGFDLASGVGGGPDLGSSTSGSSGTSTSTIGVNPTLPEVASGYWYVTPSMMQPYSSSPSGSLTAVVTATTLGFDTTVSTSTGGDSWLNALADYSAPATTPASIAPNASANISVAFAPPVGTPVGTVVQGTLQVNDENDTNSQIGDVMAAIPYEYTVGTAPVTTTTTTTTPAVTTTPSTTTTPATTTRSAIVRAKVGGAKVRGTSVSVPVSCPKTAQSACKVALKLTVVEKLEGGKVVAVAASAKPRSKTRIVVIGSATVTVAPGKSKTVDVGLNRAGKQLLDKRRTLAALLTITQGTTRLASRHVSFRATGKG